MEINNLKRQDCHKKLEPNNSIIFHHISDGKNIENMAELVTPLIW